jgi:hypothetical protein
MRAHCERLDLIDIPIGLVALVFILPAIQHGDDTLRAVDVRKDTGATRVIRTFGAGV